MTPPEDVAQHLLDTLAAALTDPPDRRYIAAGEVAFDCEQMTCEIQRIGAHQRFPDEVIEQPMKRGLVPHAAFRIAVVRCVPTSDDDGTPPSATSLAEASGQAIQDGWELFKGVTGAYKNGTLLPESPTCRLAVIGSVEWNGPDGQMLSTEITLTVALG